MLMTRILKDTRYSHGKIILSHMYLCMVWKKNLFSTIYKYMQNFGRMVNAILEAFHKMHNYYKKIHRF